MSTQSLAVHSRRRLLKWVAALFLAVAITGLPLVSSGSFGDLFAHTAQAGSPQGGSCG